MMAHSTSIIYMTKRMQGKQSRQHLPLSQSELHQENGTTASMIGIKEFSVGFSSYIWEELREVEV